MPVCLAPQDRANGQVLDLATAVKDGVLGGGVSFSCGFVEKLDLNNMIEELDEPEVPSVFICPISLEPMQDPVTLCTGQTYERSNILRWFNLGHFTCPTTMQELWDDSVTPNKTLHQLIHTWFAQKYLQMKKKSQDVIGNASEALDRLKKVKGQARVQSLKELRRIVTNHVTARTAVVDKGGVSVLSSLLGPYTSHAIGSEVVSILVNLSLDSGSRLNLMQPAKVSLVVDMLNDGSIETKINCTKLIHTLMEEDDFDFEIVSSHSLLVGLMRLVRDKRHPSGNLPGLKLLKSICWHKQVRVLIVNIGAVPQLVELLPTMNHECLELALHILDAVSTVKEGNLALSSCSSTIPNMVRVLMRVSESCTQLALSILWSICKVSPEEYSSVAVDVGLAAKLLLVIQSGCDPLLKQRSAELLKLCSLNYTDSIFISKCKLTKTIR
ncbi:putative U box domain, armadillo-like helical, Zinc finger, RING/FYVE/PHD-type [Helianthus annuus]|nr:putative U box domain, armadillo-like helical, Zinc finger, RING/FYVE/PHD-type [Helianthus annuus]